LDPDPNPARERTHLLQHTLFPTWTPDEHANAIERYAILSEGRPSETAAFFADRARMIIDVSKE
jgi:hypothetical protein